MFNPISQYEHPVILSIVNRRIGRVSRQRRAAGLAGKDVSGSRHEAADHQHSTSGNAQPVARGIAAVSDRNNQVQQLFYDMKRI
jgi:hypothetical protein